MSELDGVAAELAAARAEVNETLMMAGEYARTRAADDAVAAFLAERLDSAFNRLTAANIVGATAVEEGSRG